MKIFVFLLTLAPLSSISRDVWLFSSAIEIAVRFETISVTNYSFTEATVGCSVVILRLTKWSS